MNNTLRWILVLPGSLAGGAIAYWILNIILSFSRVGFIFSPDTVMGTLYDVVLLNAVFGYIFIFIAGYIAPTHKHQTTIILTILGGILFLTGIFTYDVDTKEIFSLIATIVGSGLAISSFKKQPYSSG